MLQIDLSDDDIDVLARIASAEARSIRDPRAQHAVVDTILNRMAMGSFGGNTVRGVVGARRQFEPVTRYGGIDNLPRVSAEQRQNIADYLERRAAGGDAVAPLASQFANWTVPYTAPAWNRWGRRMVDTQTFGRGNLQHQHGRLPEHRIPEFRIRVNGRGGAGAAGAAGGGDAFGSWLASQDEATRSAFAGYGQQQPGGQPAGRQAPQPVTGPTSGNEDAFSGWLAKQDEATRSAFAGYGQQPQQPQQGRQRQAAQPAPPPAPDKAAFKATAQPAPPPDIGPFASDPEPSPAPAPQIAAAPPPMPGPQIAAPPVPGPDMAPVPGPQIAAPPPDMAPPMPVPVPEVMPEPIPEPQPEPFNFFDGYA